MFAFITVSGLVSLIFFATLIRLFQAIFLIDGGHFLIKQMIEVNIAKLFKVKK